MALTIAEIIRAVMPNIGLILNVDAATYRVGVEDVNSDEILASLLASGVDLAALEVINTAIQAATEATETATEAIQVDAAAIEVINTAIQTAVEAIRRVPVITPTTGTGAALATLNPGANFQLLGIRIHVGSALAAAETLTVTLNANAGAAYDVVLYTQDMGTSDIRDLVIPFGGDEDFFVSGDQIVVALSANAGADTWGCETIHELT